MKKLFNDFALLCLAGFPCVALTEVLGVRLPAIFTAENLTSAFTVSVFALIVIGDYSPRVPRIPLVTVESPADEAKPESRRLAA